MSKSSDFSFLVAIGVGIGLSYMWFSQRLKEKLLTENELLHSSLPPTILRRSTLLVNDIETSLKLYRDVLGLEVIYDKNIPIAGPGLCTGVSDVMTRLVFLKSYKDQVVGVLALFSYIDKPFQQPPEIRASLKAGDSILMLNTKNVSEKIALIQEIPGVNVVRDGVIKKFPGTNGNIITVLATGFFDPDGHFCELNEVLDGAI